MYINDAPNQSSVAINVIFQSRYTPNLIASPMSDTYSNIGVSNMRRMWGDNTNYKSYVVASCCQLTNDVNLKARTKCPTYCFNNNEMWILQTSRLVENDLDKDYTARHYVRHYS